MKKIASLLLTLSLVFCVLLVLPLNVSAASTAMQDGLEVTITTDKIEYAADEDIQVSVNIKNNNSYKVEDVSIETLLPEGLVLKTGNLSATDIDIEAGTSYSVSVVAQLSEDLKDNEENKPDDTTKPNDTTKPDDATKPGGNDQETSSPQTGDNSNIVLWVVLLVASAIGIILTVKFKKTAKMMSLFLCFAMFLTMLPMSAFAAENGATIIAVDKTITIDGNQYVINANVVYKKNISVSQPVIELQCNSSLKFDDSTNKYVLINTLDSLSGTMSNNQSVVNSYFEIIFNDIVVATYSFAPTESWEVDDFGLLPGENVLKFYMTDVNNYVWEQPITIFCSIENNTEAVIGDTTSDIDSDNLPNYIEELFGTDPNSEDTDNDGLADDVEANIIGCDARKFDTDSDGTSDGDEDADDDGLTNLEELQEKTNPCNYDTDNDSLNDYDEIHTYGTSPLKIDTDGDGLDDGWEVENGKDPLVAEETIFVNDSMLSGESTAEITLNLPSELAQSFVMCAAEEEMLSTNIPGQLSSPISLTIDGILPESGATLKFSISSNYPNTTTNDFIPVIYYYNPSTQLLEEVPTTYNNHIAEAHLEHFSTYILLNKKAFDEVWEEEIRPPVGGENSSTKQDLDLLLLIDCSGSMGPQGANNDPNNIRLEVSRQLVEKTGESDRVAVISFGEYITLLTDFTNDKEVVYSAIDSVGNTDYETFINKALTKGFEVYDSSTRENAVKYMILLTDGKSSDTVRGYANNAATRNITIFTVGLGSNLDENLLRDIATSTGGKYYHASKADDLYEIYDEIEAETVDYTTDTNNDGISDYYTRLIAEGKLRDGAGNCYFAGAITQTILEQFPDCANISELVYQSIQASDDFDGDGKKNGEELIITQSGNKVYIKMISNPMYQNSDSDPFADGVEINLGGHPFAYDIQKMDLTWLTDDELYPAALSAERYVNSGWYRFQLGLGNYVYGGEYDWYYAAQKQLLDSTEVYAQKLINSYEAIYLSENFITLTNNFLSETNNVLSTYNNIAAPVSDTHIIRDIMGYMVELTEARKELAQMDLSNLSLVVDKCEEISALYSKIDRSTEKLSKIDFTEYTSLTKLSLKVPSWVTKVSSGTEKVGKVLNYFTATVNTVDEIGSTISGYGALTATSQSYGVMYDVLCKLHTNSSIGFVSVAAGELKASLESQFAQMVSETSLVLKDAASSWDEVAIDFILAKCGPVGWAIGLGRGLGNLISGIGDTCKKHIYMIAAGEAGKASAILLDSSLLEKGDFYCRASDTTLDFMLLCGTLRIAGEKGTIASSEAQSWLFKWINNHDDVESFCNEQIEIVEGILSDYGLK